MGQLVAEGKRNIVIGDIAVIVGLHGKRRIDARQILPGQQRGENQFFGPRIRSLQRRILLSQRFHGRRGFLLHVFTRSHLFLFIPLHQIASPIDLICQPQADPGQFLIRIPFCDKSLLDGKRISLIIDAAVDHIEEEKRRRRQKPAGQPLCSLFFVILFTDCPKQPPYQSEEKQNQ